MSIQTFEKRIKPSRRGGIPEPCIYYVPAAILFCSGAVMLEPIFLKVIAGIMGAALIYLNINIWNNYDNWLIKGAMESGNKSFKLPTFGGKSIYSERFFWRTYVMDNVFVHQDNTVSIAFSWEGVENRFYDEETFLHEHKRRVALLKTLPEEKGICVEHHFLRMQDDSLADRYLEEGVQMHKGEMPPIVEDIRQQVADEYRGKTRTNKIITVLSIGKVNKSGLLALFAPKAFKFDAQGKAQAKVLLELFKQLGADYPESKLLSREQYKELIETIHHPYQGHTAVDWRYELADQLIHKKPEYHDGSLKIEDVFYRVMMLQNYPKLDPSWVFKFSEAPVDVHVSQILLPISTDKAIDANKKQADFESSSISENKGTDNAIFKAVDAKGYRDYVVGNNIPVVNNTYIVTVFGTNVDEVNEISNQFSRDVIKNGGLVRDDKDLQLDMFRIRLPGMGRYTQFSREDHANTVAAMMPFTTYPTGEEWPESLRMSVSGNLVGFSPSQLEVAHELIVAETGGGKDTQFGLKVLETYKRIRYDFIELGNSYQGLIEAIGGKYCRAKEQVINPLASYDDFNQAQLLTNAGQNVTTGLLQSQREVVTPIIKGLKDTAGLNRTEEVIVDRAVRWCYENPIEGADAPILPTLEHAFDAIQIDNERQEAARDELAESLKEFLMTNTGQCFASQDQYVISPIANAIDFSGLDGEIFNYYLTFMCSRLANNAFARGARSQIVLNEYKILLEKAPEPIKWISLIIDRMGRKDWVGLSRISQGIKEVQSVDSEAMNSIPNRTLLSRKDQHRDIGELLKMPVAITREWQSFRPPDTMNTLGYREGLVCENDTWHHLYLKFPQLLLDLMNTKGPDKPLREKAYRMAKDPYKRIELLHQFQKEREANEKKHRKESENNTSLI